MTGPKVKGRGERKGKEKKEKDRKGREGKCDSSAIRREERYVRQVLRGNDVNS